MKIYPVEGRTVRDPRTREIVPARGLTVSDYDPFWARRLRDGDVTKTPPAEPKAAAEVEAAAPATQDATKAEAAAPATQATATTAATAQENKS